MSSSLLVLKQRHNEASVGSPPPVDPPPVEEPPYPLMAARPVDSLPESFGVNVHANFSGTWAQTIAWVDHAGALGIRYVCDRMPITSNPSDAVVIAHNRLRTDHGIRVLAHSGADRTYGDTLASARSRLNASLNAVQGMGGASADIYYALEGINEPNNDGAATATWVNQTRNMQQALWDMHLERNSGANRIDTIPIVGPSLARRVGGGTSFPATTQADYQALGNMTAYCDVGQIHVYPAGKQPSLFISEFRSMAQHVYPGLDLHCTEGGYFDAMQYTGGSDPTPDEVNAKYLPRQLLENMRAGNASFYQYELLDDVNPANDDRESNLGLIETPSTSPGSWTRKATWYSLRRFLALFADPGAPHTPVALHLGITPPSDPLFRSMLFGRRDGSYVLAMWRDQLLFKHNKVGGQYIPGNGTEVTVAAQPVSIGVATPRTFRFHRPSSQGTALTSMPYLTITDETVAATTIAGEVVVVEIV